MFDGLKGLGGLTGLAGMMKDLPRIKAKMEEVKVRLSQVTVDAETGGGAVSVIATAKLEVVEIRLDPALISTLVDPEHPDDRAMAEDLIAGAVNAALVKARKAAEDEFHAAAMELGLPVPPGGLGGLMGTD